MDPQFPTITVPCATRGDDITHARLTLYPATIGLQLGNFVHDSFNLQRFEVLPLRAYPELAALHDGGRWQAEKVATWVNEPRHVGRGA